MAAAVGQEREAPGFQDFHGALDAVSAPMFALSAGAVDEFVALDAHGVLEREGLEGGVKIIAHPDVDAGCPIPPGARALPAADGLVVGPPLPADDQVVHRPLALGGYRFRGE